VRTLYLGLRSAGTYDDPWDGGDDADNVAVDADYYAYIDYTIGGVISTKPDQPSGNYQYQATYTETPSNGAGIVPWEDFFWTMYFRTLSYGASEITLTVTPYRVGNVIVAEPFTREVFGAGTHTAYWEGLTSAGQYITDSDLDIGRDGDFLWAAFGYTLPDNAIVIEGGRPVITNPTATPNYVRAPDSPSCIGDAGTDIGLTLAREASVTLRAFSMDTGALVGQVISGMLPAGTNTVNWDCRAVSGEFVEAGNYYVEITATAADGNISRLRRVLVQVWY
jgi:flagellar hook assembly protein FlgD